MPWVKGQSGNPKGAPRRHDSLARLIRAETDNGAELVRHALGVMRGEIQATRVSADEGGKAEPVAPSIAEQNKAREWLADRGWGKAVEHVEITDETAVNPTTIATERLEDGLGPQGTVQ